MAIAKLDFNRGQVVNPLNALGDDLTRSGQIFRQQELDKANLERQMNADRRAQEALDMEKQKYADQVNAKAASNQYYNQLTNALAPGNIGISDQNTLGTQIANLGQQAQNAYDSGDKTTGDKLVAQQQSILATQVPQMQQNYQNNPQAKIDLLGSIAGPANMDIRDRIGVLRDTTAPLDKQLADRAAYAAKIEEARVRGQERHADKVFQYNMAKAIADQARQTQLDLAKFNQANQLKMKEMEINAKDHKTDNYVDQDGKVWALTPNELNAKTAAGATFTLAPHGTSTGSGEGNKKGTVTDDGKHYVSVGGVKVPTSFDTYGTGLGDTTSAAEYADKLIGLGKTKDEVQGAINRIDVGTSVMGDRHLDESNVDRYVPPMELKGGVILPASTAVKINEKRGLQIVTDSKGKVKWGGTGKELTPQDLTDLGFKVVNGVAVPADKEIASTVINNVKQYKPVSELPDDSDLLSRQLAATKPITPISQNPVASKTQSPTPTGYDSINDEDIKALNAYLEQRNANNPQTSNFIRLLQGTPSR